MGKRNGMFVAAIFLSVGILAGCGGNKNNTNVAEGMAKLAQMDYSGALTSFETALEAGENVRLVYRGMGIAQIGLTEYAQAIDSLNTCLQLSNGMIQNMDFDVNYYLATAYYKNGNLREAADTYTAILNLRPDETDAHFLRGTALLALGEYEQAREDFDRVLSLTNGDCDRLIAIYQALEEYGYREIGEQYLQQTLKERGDKLKDYDKGRICYYLKDYLQACNYLEKSKDTDNAEAYLYLGRAYEATGDYNYAASVYTSYTAKDSGNAEVYNQLGLCRMKQGEYEQALEAFQAAMKIEDNGIMQALQFNEIVAYEYLGQYKQAAVLMSNYVSTYPDDADARREYEFLKTR